MLQGIALREFSREDLAALYRLVQNTIEAAYGGVYPPEAVAFFKDYHSQENILNDAAGGYTVVAEQDGEILGTGTLLECNVRRVFTDVSRQNRGIGGTIAVELESRARTKKAPSLDLAASLVSRQFWESFGFIVSQEDFIPVGNGQKLRYYRMLKKLNGN